MDVEEQGHCNRGGTRGGLDGAIAPLKAVVPPALTGVALGEG